MEQNVIKTEEKWPELSGIEHNEMEQTGVDRGRKTEPKENEQNIFIIVEQGTSSLHLEKNMPCKTTKCNRAQRDGIN